MNNPPPFHRPYFLDNSQPNLVQWPRPLFCYNPPYHPAPRLSFHSEFRPLVHDTATSFQNFRVPTHQAFDCSRSTLTYPDRPTVSYDQRQYNENVDMSYVHQGDLSHGSLNILDLDSISGWESFMREKQELQNFLNDVAVLPSKTKPHCSSLVNFSNQCKDVEMNLRSLKLKYAELNSLKFKASDESWSELVTDIAGIRKALDSNLSKIKCDNSISKKAKLRLKKRKWKKKRNAAVKEQKENLHGEWRQKENEIDKKLREVQEEHHRKKNEEETQKTADSVLSEVKGKQNEAKQMLEMLKTISKLRKARVDAAIASGQRSREEEADSTFEKGRDLLECLMSGRLADYEKEESALRVMLQPDDTQPNRKTYLGGKSPKETLEMLLFGKREQAGFTNAPSTKRPETLDELVSVRWDWDRFLVAPGTPWASTLPRSLVYPAEPSSEEWKAFLVERH